MLLEPAESACHLGSPEGERKSAERAVVALDSLARTKVLLKLPQRGNLGIDQGGNSSRRKPAEEVELGHELDPYIAKMPNR